MFADEISASQKEAGPYDPRCRQLPPITQPPQHWDRSLGLFDRQTAFLPAAFLITLKHRFKARFQRRTRLLIRQQRQFLPQRSFLAAGGALRQMLFHYFHSVSAKSALQIVR